MSHIKRGVHGSPQRKQGGTLRLHASPCLRCGLPSSLHLMIVVAAFLVPAALLAGEIRTLDGKSYPGEIVALSPTDVQVRSSDGQKVSVYPLKEVIGIDWGIPTRPITRVPYLRVRFVDGTQVYCLTFDLKSKNVKMLLISGQTIETSLDQVHHVVCDAQETASLAAFETILNDNPKQDFIRVQSRDTSAIEPYDGLIEGANEQGTRLTFKARGLNTVSSIDVARLRGLYFSRSGIGLGPNAVARIYDTFGNCFIATSYHWGETHCDITTQMGSKVRLVRSTVLRFDLTPGKMDYLSDLEPIKVEETPILSELYHHRRDKNLEGGPLSVGRKVYPKGLALHSKTVLEYDIKGYSSFRCVLGLDDAMAGSAHAVVRIEGDDKELLATVISSRENKPQEIVLDVKGLQKLRLIVDYGEDLDLGDHIDFADARLIK